MEEAKLQEVENQLLEVWNRFYHQYNEFLFDEMVAKGGEEAAVEHEPLDDPTCNSPSKMVSIGIQTVPEPTEFAWIPLSNAMKLVPGRCRLYPASHFLTKRSNYVDIERNLLSDSRKTPCPYFC
jgi:hypothetical protein